jgi:hypothetical protein
MSNDQQPPKTQSSGNDLAPGQAWSEIIKRPTLGEFSVAFTTDVALDASVLPRTVRGAPDIRAVFDATREMYDTIAFSREENSASRT